MSFGNRKRQQTPYEKTCVETFPPATRIPHPGHFSVISVTAFPCFKGVAHLRFLMNIKLSFWQTYSKPTSKRALEAFKTLKEVVKAAPGLMFWSFWESLRLK